MSLCQNAPHHCLLKQMAKLLALPLHILNVSILNLEQETGGLLKDSVVSLSPSRPNFRHYPCTCQVKLQSLEQIFNWNLPFMKQEGYPLDRNSHMNLKKSLVVLWDFLLLMPSKCNPRASRSKKPSEKKDDFLWYWNITAMEMLNI
jgi:hypothetical protein